MKNLDEQSIKEYLKENLSIFIDINSCRSYFTYDKRYKTIEVSLKLGNEIISSSQIDIEQ